MWENLWYWHNISQSFFTWLPHHTELCGNKSVLKRQSVFYISVHQEPLEVFDWSLILLCMCKVKPCTQVVFPEKPHWIESVSYLLLWRFYIQNIWFEFKDMTCMVCIELLKSTNIKIMKKIYSKHNNATLYKKIIYTDLIDYAHLLVIILCIQIKPPTIDHCSL